MKIALVITVKNEVRLLRNNLLYHKAIGVDKAFVYFDNTTDNGWESIADLDFVSVYSSIAIEKYSHFKYLDKFTSQAAEHHTARQCLNTFDAQQQCLEAGIDWLISIDADELVCTDFQKSSQLKVFFKDVISEVEIVSFETLEALQRKRSYYNIFEEETLFKANRTAFVKNLYNPFTKAQQRFSWWYGHTMGKCAIRVKTNLVPHNVHRYKRINGNPITVKKGNILHYHAYDAADFIKKFTNFSDHPNTFLSGNKVEDIKLLLRDVVNISGKGQEELENYFNDNLLFTEKEVIKIKKGKKYIFFKINPEPIKEVRSVRMTFQNM